MHPINGLLLVDKPMGCTSHDVVDRARRILGMRNIGHAGTLDPIATGLMVLLIGEATKISDYVLSGDKAYEVKVRLGVQTDSLDMSGTVLSTSAVNASADEIRTAAASLIGPLELPVPKHSAVKVSGRRLYDYARKDDDVAVPMRTMTFSELEVLEVETSSLRVRFRCTKGSYVRSWAEALGLKLGTGAAVEELRRIRSLPYSVENALTLEELASRWESSPERHGKVLGSAWIPLRDTMPLSPSLNVQLHDEYLVKNGQIPNSLQVQLLRLVMQGAAQPPVKVVSSESQDLLSLLHFEAGRGYRIRRVFLQT